jgi:DNA-binding response OmpR family regulator
LLLDPTPLGMSILVQIVMGLGAKHLHRCETVALAKEVIKDFEIDLVIADTLAQTGEGYEFVRWLRREGREPNRHAPVLLTAAHTRIRDIHLARDCGSHYVVAKPLAPITVLERIIWISRDRGFLMSDDYVGPDRRTRAVDLPVGRPGRRREDRLKGTAPEDHATTGEGPTEADGQS